MQQWRAQLYELEEHQLDFTVWRYLTFPKFIHLISSGSLWFQRLQFLNDNLEGSLPKATETAMTASYQKSKKVFNTPELQKQIDEMASRNVSDGRSLTAVNCWFIGDDESERMWNEYVGSSEGVAVRSTAKSLRDSVFLYPEFSFIGRVKYVDYATHDMGIYDGHQAYRRAFLKDSAQFSHENELRLSTMNTKTSACVDSLGQSFPESELKGAGMNNFDEAGLNVRVDLERLFNTVVSAPGAPSWFHDLLIQISLKSGFSWNVERSSFHPKD